MCTCTVTLASPPPPSPPPKKKTKKKTVGVSKQRRYGKRKGWIVKKKRKRVLNNWHKGLISGPLFFSLSPSSPLRPPPPPFAPLPPPPSTLSAKLWLHFTQALYSYCSVHAARAQICISRCTCICRSLGRSCTPQAPAGRHWECFHCDQSGVSLALKDNVILPSVT